MLPLSPNPDAAAPRSSSRALAFLALILLVPVPTIGVLGAMVFPATQGTPLGQGLYLAAKIWLVAFPLMWRLLVERQRLSLSPMKPDERGSGLRMGLITGVVIAVAIFAGHWLVGRHVIDIIALRTAAAENDIGDPARYIVLALGLTLFNSLVEEYVWRWFVYRQCEQLMPSKVAVVASALMFTAHHYFALRDQMGPMPTLLACGGIFIGGCIWSALYRRYRSIWPGYVSHIMADAAVFSVGWMLLFR